MSLGPNPFAVITGATGSAGAAIVRHLAARNSSVVMVGRDQARLAEAAVGPGSPHGGHRTIVADLASDDEVERVAAELRAATDRIDVLVHGAGVFEMGPAEHAPIEHLDRQFRVNARAPYLLTQRLLGMLIACQGQVVFLNSSAGLTARAGVGAYAATKFALRAMADSLRDEVNATGVRVLNVFLGRMAGPMQEGIHRAEAKPYHPERLIQPDDVAGIVLSVLDLPRTAEVTDIHVRPMAKP